MNYLRNPDIKTTLMPDGHVVLFSAKTEWAQVLNPTGALVWEFCDGDTPIESITSQIGGLLAITDIPELQKEINSLIKELLGSGLLHEVEVADIPIT